MNAEKSAKEIFWEYACSHFFMDRDGARDHYLRIGGGKKDIEEEWRKEYIEHWTSLVTTSDLSPLRKLMNAEASEAIPALLAIADYGDDYSKFWFAFTLQTLARDRSAERGDKANAAAKAKALFEELLRAPSGVSPMHRREVKPYMLEAFKAKNAEEYIRNYTIRRLNPK